MPGSLDPANWGRNELLFCDGGKAQRRRPHRGQHRMRRRTERADLLVAGLRGHAGRVYLDAVLPWTRTVDVRGLGCAEGRKEQCAKQHKATTPRRKHEA